MEDPLLVFDLIKLLPFAGGYSDMLGDGPVILVESAVSFCNPCA